LGGLGVQSANAIAGLAAGEAIVHAFGPGHITRWPLPDKSSNIRWHESPQFIPSWASRYTRYRWNYGDLQFRQDTLLGQWAATSIERLNPQYCYLFTQVGLETLRWAKRAGVPTILENPNGHIRNFRRVNEQESRRWCGKGFKGHPSPEMIERVEEEYYLADRIRVSSQWSKASMVNSGVPADKIEVLQQPVNLTGFHPPLSHKEPDGPLRICFVGSLDLRKGFVYLLQAMKLIGNSHIELEIVGATGSRCCSRLFARESAGLMIKRAPGDPIPAYHRAELFVLPTLEDGSPFAVAEAMACGLPILVTESCGSAEWIRDGLTGWVVPACQPEAIARALEEALRNRKELRAMGLMARADVERRGGPDCFRHLNDWVYYNEQLCQQ
jgi:glycosyltransferase involved in cell wall biosynthesis